METNTLGCLEHFLLLLLFKLYPTIWGRNRFDLIEHFQSCVSTCTGAIFKLVMLEGILGGSLRDLGSNKMWELGLLTGWRQNRTYILWLLPLPSREYLRVTWAKENECSSWVQREWRKQLTTIPHTCLNPEASWPPWTPSPFSPFRSRFPLLKWENFQDVAGSCVVLDSTLKWWEFEHRSHVFPSSFTGRF